jgi:hypothetical protein
MSYQSVILRYLDPGEALGEALFGLIMALTFSVGARLVTTLGEPDPRTLILTAIGCNVAWGVIDATLFVFSGLFHRSQRARFFRALKSARSEEDALAAIREEFALEDEPLTVVREDHARLHRSILALSAHATPARVHLRRRDLVSALFVFALVAFTGLPGVIPFLLLDDFNVALRLSNIVLVSLLFLVGFWWGHYTDVRPWIVGVTVMLLGLSMVFVAVALGG